MFLYPVLFLLAAVILVNGWTDAPNAITAPVAAGVLPFPLAVAMAAVCNLLGVVCTARVSDAVARTLYSIADFGPQALTALTAALSATVLWAVCAWRFGIPTSESHALVAGISGAAAALEGSFSCIRWDCWAKVGLGLILSSAAGFWAGRTVYCRLSSVKLSDHTLLLAQLPGRVVRAVLVSHLTELFDGNLKGKSGLFIDLRVRQDRIE